MRRPLRSDRARALADLAIDLGDPGRMARARKLHRSGAVSSIAVQAGAIETVVYGGEPEPYRILIELVSEPADGATPRANNIVTQCSCADFSDVCKHALASVLGFAEEVEAEPDLLEDFIGRPETAETQLRRSFAADPFFTGSWPPDPPAPELSHLAIASPTSLVVDGVDAWPVLRNAIEVMGQQMAPRRAR